VSTSTPVSEMEGASTKISKKRSGKKRESPTFVLSMLISDDSVFCPDVTLCGKKGKSSAMAILNPTPTDGIISYQAGYHCC